METIHGKLCPCCQKPVLQGENAVTCTRCGTVHHSACWERMGRCATPGCDGTPVPVAKPEIVPATQAKPEAAVMGKPASGPVAAVYQSRETLVFPDAFVALEEICLVLNRETETLSARLCFRSLASKPIVAMRVMVQCMDVWGENLGSPVRRDYIDLYAETNTRFGQNVAIALPDSATRRAEITVTRVMLADGTAYNCSAKPGALPPSVLLSEHLGGGEMAQEYALRTTPQAQFVPQMGQKYWRCTCGSIHSNTVAVCPQCGCDFTYLTQSLSRDSLMAGVQLRLASQQKPTAAQPGAVPQPSLVEVPAPQGVAYPAAQQAVPPAGPERKTQKEKKPKKQKRSHPVRNTIIVLLILGLLGAGVLLGPPAYRYYGAKQALNNGEYDRAYEEFCALGNFYNSQEMSKESLYWKGVSLRDQGRYKEAYEILSLIPDYRNVPEIVENVCDILYEQGISLVESGKYKEARQVLSSISAYRDVTWLLEDLENEENYAAIVGCWRTKHSSIKTLYLYPNHTMRTNLDSKDLKSNEAYMSGNVLCEVDAQGNRIRICWVKVLDEDTIHVFWYANNTDYTMYRS